MLVLEELCCLMLSKPMDVVRASTGRSECSSALAACLGLGLVVFWLCLNLVVFFVALSAKDS